MNDEVTHADILKRLDSLEERLEPVLETWEDVAVIGRYSRLALRGVMWTAGLVVAVMAAWTTLTQP